MLKIYLILTNFIIINSLPVIFLHGFMDSCQNKFFNALTNLITAKIGEYSECIESGGNFVDLSTSFESQAEKACENIKNNIHFQGDFAILSLSQGGLIGRYIIEKCKMKGTVKKFVSFGGPMAGSSLLPFCHGGVICYLLNSFTNWAVYKKFAQDNIGPSGYFRTNLHIDEYKNSDSFLVKLNNEGKNNDTEAIKRFLKLEKLVLIGFKNDQMIAPKESAAFGEFDKNYKVIQMNNTHLYVNDTIGLKQLNEDGKVEIHYLEGGHLNLTYDIIIEYAFPHFMNSTTNSN